MENKKCKIEGCIENAYKCEKCKKHYTDNKLTNKHFKKEEIKQNESGI